MSGAYGVFAEEHEGTRSLGVLDGDYWNVNSAYYYADSNTVWRFDATEDDIQ